MTITKTHLKDLLSTRIDLPKKQSSQIVEALLEEIKSTLSSGEDILISGFGKFCVKDKKGRRGRNPSTGEDLFLDSRRVVLFKPSTLLRKRMNSNIHQ
jgi:integration host factor subunit alpha